jgi:hypothetical protein
MLTKDEQRYREITYHSALLLFILSLVGILILVITPETISPNSFPYFLIGFLVSALVWITVWYFFKKDIKKAIPLSYIFFSTLLFLKPLSIFYSPYLFLILMFISISFLYLTYRTQQEQNRLSQKKQSV